MENIQTILAYVAHYGLIFVFFIIFLEYMNFPGLGAAVVLPGIGIATARCNLNIVLVIVISIIAGEIASYILFGISYYFGKTILNKLYNKFPKTQKSINKAFYYVESYGYKGVLIARMLPVARTIVPFVSGMFRMNFVKFAMCSIVGVVVWNSVLIYAGYAFSSYFI